MNPEDIMTATDEEIEALDTSTTVEVTEEPSTSAEEGTNEPKAETVESTEVPTEPSEPEETDVPPSSILEMSDEDFEKYVAESETYIDEDSPKDTSKKEEVEEVVEEDLAPSIEELRAKAKALEENLKKNDVINKNRELVEALDVNGLLSPEKVNRLIGIAKGDKKALVALLDEQGIDVSSLVEAPKKTVKKPVETSTEADITDEDDFDKWLSGEDSEETETKKEEAEEEEVESTVEEQPADEGNIDYLDKLATEKVGKVAVEIINEYGQEILDGVDHHIDVPSFEMLKRNPEDLKALAEQKKSGVMDLINDRIKQLDEQGMFPTNFPYLSKYKFAGNILIQEANKPQKPIDRRVATTESTIDSKLKHAQSSTSGTAPTSGSKDVDPYNIFTMPEEEFNKLK